MLGGVQEAELSTAPDLFMTRLQAERVPQRTRNAEDPPPEDHRVSPLGEAGICGVDAMHARD